MPGLSNSVCYRACQCIVQTNKQQHSVPINDEWQRQLGVNIPLIKHYLKKKPPCESANYSLFRCIFNTVSAMTLLVCTHCCGLFGVWASESQCWMWQTVTGQTDKPVDAVEVVDDYNYSADFRIVTQLVWQLMGFLRDVCCQKKHFSFLQMISAGVTHWEKFMREKRMTHSKLKLCCKGIFGKLT